MTTRLVIEVRDKNDPKKHPLADYWIQVYDNGTEVLGGAVSGHVRAEGWRGLLKLVVQELTDSLANGWGKKP